MAASTRIPDEPEDVLRREAAFRAGMLAEQLRHTHGAASRPVDEIMRSIVLTAGK